MNVIEDTLLDFQRQRSLDGSSSNNNNNNINTGGSGPYNTADALIMAAIDVDIHLDCVHFLLRRHPDVLHQLSSSTTTTPAAAATLDPNNNSNNNEYYDSKQKHRRRKRGGS